MEDLGTTVALGTIRTLNISYQEETAMNQKRKVAPIALGWLGALALVGCTMGVDGDYVGLEGAVVGADSAELSEGRLAGPAIALDIEGDADRLYVGFTIPDLER